MIIIIVFFFNKLQVLKQFQFHCMECEVNLLHNILY